MAHFGRDDSFSAARTVQIIGSETNENFTVYTIEMTVGSFTWTVKHRYSEFHELHEKLVTNHKVDKALLPPKKLFGNQSESFVKKRQQDLQLYLQTILNLLAMRPPPALTYFLHFNLYEIHGITQTMAEDLYNRGEMLLQSDQVYRVTPLQLHSLTERLKLPEPTCDSGDVRKDLGHILDFITRTKYLQIIGSSEWVGNSNINMNLLPFDLSLFKSIHTLEAVNCSFDMVQGLETVKQTLKVLKVYQTANTVKEVVLQDVPQWKGEDGSELVGGWDHVTRVDFSHNFIKDIDSSVQILWRVEKLDLSHNRLEGVQHLQWLSHMTHLNLSHNRLHVLDALHTKLGNLKCLLLQGNQIESLHGFSKLFSLEMLDVSDNKIAKVEDVRPACQLPCMEKLKLTGNAVILTVDYRTRILEMFGDRVGEVRLDGEKASQKEKDTVAVRLALQKAKDARSRQAAPRKTSSAASLTDVCGGRGETPPPPTRQSPLPTCGASAHNSSALGQGQGAGNSQISSSAPHHSLTHQWSQPDLKHAPPVTIFLPGRTSPGQTSSSCTAGQEMWVEGVDLPSPIPEAHPFDPSSDPMPSPPAKRKEYSVADLPSTSRQDFITWLEKQLQVDTATPALSPLSLDSAGASQVGQRQQVTAVMWCYVQLYSAPAAIFPCCAILTTTRLLLQRLSGSPGVAGCPGLRACLVLPLSSIQHVVVGPGYAYLRVEEAFVGKGGLFTLFAVEVEVMKLFAEALQDCCTQLDPTNPLDILDLLCQSDLLTEVCHREKKAGLMSDYLALTLLVRVREGEEVKTCLLVMSENVVYLMDVGCVYWPPATFQSAEEGSMHLRVLEELSILTDITDISLNNSSLHSGGGGLQNRVDFTTFSLTLHIHPSSSSKGPRQLMLLFNASSSREVFVERLNNLRARHGHSIPTLEVPEGSGSAELADSSFQTCRSECSSVACNENGACNHSRLSCSSGAGPAHSASPVKSQCSSSTADTKPSGLPEPSNISSDVHNSSGVGGRPEDGEERDIQVSVEAEIHNQCVSPDVHSHGDLNGSVQKHCDPADDEKSDGGAEHPGHDEKPPEHSDAPTDGDCEGVRLENSDIWSKDADECSGGLENNAEDCDKERLRGDEAHVKCPESREDCSRDNTEEPSGASEDNSEHNIGECVGKCPESREDCSRDNTEEPSGASEEHSEHNIGECVGNCKLYFEENGEQLEEKEEHKSEGKE